MFLDPGSAAHHFVLRCARGMQSAAAVRRPNLCYSPAMAEPVSLIMRQFLAWVGERPRRREEVREAWRSCPRISGWEDAGMEGLVAAPWSGLPSLPARRALGADVERIERLARGHEQAVALEAAEADVGAALGQLDAADELAGGGREHARAARLSV